MRDESGKRRWNVLVSAPRAVQVIERYATELGAAGCDVIACNPVERLEESELLPVVGEVDAIICGDDRISSRVLDAAPRLRVIAKWGTGIDSIDVAAARARGVAVCNSPGAFSDPVADTVMGYVLLFARRLDAMAADMRAGHWRRQTLHSLKEYTLGIVGLGQIGSAVARRAGAFGMRVLATAIPDSNSCGVLEPAPDLVPFDILLGESDFVTLHCDLRAGNRNMIDSSRLARMKPSAVLINTARGGLVDEAALVAALRAGRLAGAALDVFEVEPLAADSPLRQLPNVYLAPHNANASVAAAEQVHANCIRQVIGVLLEAE